MKNLLQKIIGKQKISHTKKISNPHEKWIVMLRIFLVITIILIVFSLYLLYKIKNDQVFKVKTTSSNSPSVLDSNLLDKVTKNFDQREKISEAIKSNNTLYKDPSFN